MQGIRSLPGRDRSLCNTVSKGRVGAWRCTKCTARDAHSDSLHGYQMSDGVWEPWLSTMIIQNIVNPRAMSTLAMRAGFALVLAPELPFCARGLPEAASACLGCAASSSPALGTDLYSAAISEGVLWAKDWVQGAHAGRCGERGIVWRWQAVIRQCATGGKSSTPRTPAGPQFWRPSPHTTHLYSVAWYTSTRAVLPTAPASMRCAATVLLALAAASHAAAASLSATERIHAVINDPTQHGRHLQGGSHMLQLLTEAATPSERVRGVQTMWHEQTLDHFNAIVTDTFKQRFYVNSQFWNGTGPVFVYIGGEGEWRPLPRSACPAKGELLRLRCPAHSLPRPSRQLPCPPIPSREE